MADLNLSSVRLPPAFQECEYIESHGTEYISVGVIPHENITSRICYPSFDNVGIIGTNNSIYTYDGRYSFGFVSPSVGWRLNYGNSTNNNYSGKVDNDVHTLELLPNGKHCELWIDGDFAVAADATTIVNPSSDFYLFAHHSGNNAACYSMRIYFFSMPQINLIPCYLKTAWNGIQVGTIGLYDLCGSISSNGTPFYTNEGTGAFTKGPDVVHADAITINGKDVAALTDSSGIAWKTPGDVFVASWGDDTTGDGSLLRPVKTIGRADALAKNGDTITLLTDITLTSNLTMQHSVTLMGYKKAVELHLNRNVYLYFASGTNERIEKITVSCDEHGSSGDSYHPVIQCPASGTLTVENVLFDRCNDYYATQAYSRYGLLGTNYRSGTLTVRNCKIQNSVCTGLVKTRSNYDNLYEHITVGQNVQIITRHPGVVESAPIIATGWNEVVKVAPIGYVSSESNIDLIALGYYLNTNTDVHHISGVGNIEFTRYGSGRGILREIDLVGTLNIQKPNYIGGKIRGTLTVTDTYRAAADGNVFFEGYNGYTITQDDFASMTWGGAAGYHLALENNKILLRAN